MTRSLLGIYREQTFLKMTAIEIKRRFHRQYPLNIRIVKSWIALILFFIGGLIYLAYRQETLQMFHWADMIGVTSQINDLRNLINGEGLYGWVKYSLPDGLWLFSYMFIVDSIWNGDKHISSSIFIFVLPVFAILSEFAQYFDLLPGVFDILDLESYTFAIVLYLIIKIL